MNTYTLKPSKSMNYTWLAFGIFFLIATIGTLYVLLFLVPADSNLPKSIYAVLLPFLAIMGFSFYKVKSQNELAAFNLDEDGFTNTKTNQTVLWKNISDLYFFSSGKVMGLANNLAYRTAENENFTHITAMQYSIEGLETMEAFHLKPRTEKVLENIRNGKTEKFHYLPLKNTIQQAFNLTESQFLQFDSDEILLNNTALIYKDKTYSLQDVAVIGLGNSGKYQLKTKSGTAILEFNKLSVISCEVFRNVVNELVKN